MGNKRELKDWVETLEVIAFVGFLLFTEFVLFIITEPVPEGVDDPQSYFETHKAPWLGVLGWTIVFILLGIGILEIGLRLYILEKYQGKIVIKGWVSHRYRMAEEIKWVVTKIVKYEELSNYEKKRIHNVILLQHDRLMNFDETHMLPEDKEYLEAIDVLKKKIDSGEMAESTEEQAEAKA